MKIDRRQILLGSAALALSPHDKAEAWFPHGASSAIPIGHGWNTLPLGAGGLVTGFHIAADNSIVCRTDVGNIYRWTGKTTDITNPSDEWVPLLTFPSLAGLSSNPQTNYSWGGLEIVQAPSDATKIWAIFPPLSDGIISPVYYSTNSGGTWSASNITATNTDPNSPPYSKRAFYRIAADPANSSVVYVGMPPSNGNSYGVWVATDGHTFSAVTVLGQTTVGTGACGICFDASSGTTGGKTNRIIIPVGGVDIYESNDGGSTWVSTGAATTFGTAAFSLNNGVINSGGVYYAAVNNIGIFRYSGFGGTWTNITPSGGTPGTSTFLVIDPADPTYLTITGERGSAYGWTSLNANTGSPVVWTGATSSSSVTCTAPSYDLYWINDIFGQGTNINYGIDETCMAIDGNGDTIIAGNQSIWKISGRVVYNGPSNYTLVSFGRGQEATVAQEAWRPSGGTYPILGPQDFGVVTGNTFTKYPTAIFPLHKEFTCSSIEESPADGTFVVVRVTGQGGGTAVEDSSGYSTDAGASFTAYATFPTLLWSSNIHGSITSGVLTVTSFDSGSALFIGQEVFSSGATVAAGYISSFGTGTGGIGTYNLVGGVNAGSQSLFLQANNAGGQIIAADNNHHLIVPAGLSHGSFPVQTPDRGASWAACNGLPAGSWMTDTWSFAPNAKPIAVGFGADIGIVLAAVRTSSTLVTIYKSTDYGANFSATANTVTIPAIVSGYVYLVAVPGHLGEFWLAIKRSTSLWKSINYGDTWASISTPPLSGSYTTTGYFSIGAIDPISGTYPTLWLTGGDVHDPTRGLFLYYSIDAAASWSILGSSGPSGVKPDLPIRQQMYGLGTVRADRQTFKRLYASCGQTGFAYYNP